MPSVGYQVTFVQGLPFSRCFLCNVRKARLSFGILFDLLWLSLVVRNSEFETSDNSKVSLLRLALFLSHFLDVEHVHFKSSSGNFRLKQFYY